MKIQTITTKNLIVKSKLPASDYVINPYVGCAHKCHYCYASFMKRFSGHSEDWGDFIDVKQCSHMKLPKNSVGKTLLLSSVTDPYQPLEKRFEVTRQLLEQLNGFSGNLEILTKSHLVTRDIDLFSRFPQIQIGISMNTLDDHFRKDMEPGASSVSQRLEALKVLSENSIPTYLFVSPIFPGITDLVSLIEQTAPYVQKICFENLNLRGNKKDLIISYIKNNYPNLLPLYQDIYMHHNMSYWTEMECFLKDLENQYSIPFVNYFYHEKIKKKEN